MRAVLSLFYRTAPLVAPRSVELVPRACRSCRDALLVRLRAPQRARLARSIGYSLGTRHCILLTCDNVCVRVYVCACVRACVRACAGDFLCSKFKTPPIENTTVVFSTYIQNTTVAKFKTLKFQKPNIHMLHYI